MPGTNPFSRANKQARRRAENTQYVLAEVEEVAPESHMVKAKVRGEDGDLEASVPAERLGDISLPNVGEHVLVSHTQGGWPIAHGVIYHDDDSVPSYTPGDRRMGNAESGSHVTVGESGDVGISADSTQVGEAHAEDDHTQNNNINIHTDGSLEITNGRESANVSIDDDGTTVISTDNGESQVLLNQDGSVVVAADSIRLNSADIHMGGSGTVNGIAREGDAVERRYGGDDVLTEGSEHVRST